LSIRDPPSPPIPLSDPDGFVGCIAFCHLSPGDRPLRVFFPFCFWAVSGCVLSWFVLSVRRVPPDHGPSILSACVFFCLSFFSAFFFSHFFRFPFFFLLREYLSAVFGLPPPFIIPVSDRQSVYPPRVALTSLPPLFYFGQITLLPPPLML